MSNSAERRLGIIEAILGIQNNECAFPECNECLEEECPLLENTIKELATQMDFVRELLQYLESVLEELRKKGVLTENLKEVARLKVKKDYLEVKAEETKVLLSSLSEGTMKDLFQVSLKKKFSDLQQVSEALEELESE